MTVSGLLTTNMQLALPVQGPSHPVNCCPGPGVASNVMLVPMAAVVPQGPGHWRSKCFPSKVVPLPLPERVTEMVQFGLQLSVVSSGALVACVDKIRRSVTANAFQFAACMAVPFTADQDDYHGIGDELTQPRRNAHVLSGSEWIADT